MSLVKDKFLTEILEKDAFCLVVGGYEYEYEYEVYPKNSFIYRKTSDVTELNWSIKAGFNLICSEITFSGIPTFPKYDVNYKQVVDAVHYPFVGSLAKDCFYTDRFHRDNSIPHTEAEKVKEEWLRNALAGKRGDRVFLAVDDRNFPLGFLVVIHGKDKVIVDLFGVSNKAKGQKVGSSLMRWLVLNYPGQTIQAGTQIDNLLAINLYKKFGIDKIVDFKYVLHLHT